MRSVAQSQNIQPDDIYIDIDAINPTCTPLNGAYHHPVSPVLPNASSESSPVMPLPELQSLQNRLISAGLLDNADTLSKKGYEMLTSFYDWSTNTPPSLKLLFMVEMRRLLNLAILEGSSSSYTSLCSFARRYRDVLLGYSNDPTFAKEVSDLFVGTVARTGKIGLVAAWLEGCPYYKISPNDEAPDLVNLLIHTLVPKQSSKDYASACRAIRPLISYDDLNDEVYRNFMKSTGQLSQTCNEILRARVTAETYRRYLKMLGRIEILTKHVAKRFGADAVDVVDRRINGLVE